MATNISTGGGSTEEINRTIKEGANAGAFTSSGTGTKTDLGKAIVDRIKTSGGNIDSNIDILDPNVSRIPTGTGARTSLTGTGSIGGTGGGTIGGGTTTLLEETPITDTGIITDGDAVTGDQNIPVEDTSVDDGLAAAINEYIAGLTGANQAAFEANVSNIQAEETIAVQSQEELKRQAQTDYLNALDEINKGVFDVTQRAKVSSEARGIGSSQQAEALQQGIAREGLGLRFKNDQDRTARISNIVDRIAAIQTSTAQRITAAGQEQQAANLAAQAEGGRLGLERGFELEDQASLRDFTTSEREAIQEFTLGRDATAFENQMFAAAQQNDWNVDAAYLSNVNMMSRLNVSNSHAEKMLGLNQQFGLDMANLSFANAKEIASLDFDRTKQLARLGEDSQLRIMNAANNYTTTQNESRIALEYQLQNVLEFGPNVTRDQIVENVFNDNKTAIGFLRFFTPKIFGLEESQIKRLTDDQIREQIKGKETEVNNYLRSIGF